MNSVSTNSNNQDATKKVKKYMSDKKFGWILISPLVVMLIVFMLYPTIYAIFMSVQKNIGKGVEGYIGADNYRAMLTNPEMWASLRRTVILIVVCIVFELVLGMLIALILNRDFKGMNVVRGLCFMPLLIAPLAMSLMWSYMLRTGYGPINVLLGHLGITGIGWFADVKMAFGTIIGITIWQWLPFSTFVLLAGLKGLPKDQFEAAQVDGSSALYRFRRLTLPTLKPLIMIIVLLRVMWLIRTYDPLYGTTKGGMNTELFDWFVFKQPFVYSNIGTGTALGIFSLVITLLLANVLYRYLMKAMNENS